MYETFLLSAKQKALDLLNRSEQCRFRLQRKLAAKDYTPEEIRRISEEIDRLNLQPALSIEEALAEADRRAKAEAIDPSLRSLKKWHGVWENSKAWGKDVDVVAEIRKMRDEWGDPWAEAQNGYTKICIGLNGGH